MKKYLSLLILLACAVFSYAQDPAYPAAPAAPLNITAAESFVDTDPGIGKGNVITIAAVTDISNTAAAVNVTGLSNGVHTLYIRTRSNEGHWSITSIKDFLYDANPVYTASPAAAQNIIAAEYFIDTDPGFGSGSPIAITAGVDLNNAAVAVNTSALTNGSHRLYIRTKSTEGRWSLVQAKDFIMDFDFQYPTAPAAAQNMIAAEYFFDTDPGFGSGTQVSITPGADLNSVAAAVNTAGLTIGTHRLYFRSKSQEGRWAMTLVRDFIVDSDFPYPSAPAAAQNMIAAEYFFDTDPGFGNGAQLSTTAATDLNAITATVSTTGLGLGTHRLYFRTKNQEGHWAITLMKDFIVDSDFSYPSAPTAAQNIVAAEYFFDTDPGFGNGAQLSITEATDLNAVAATVSTTGLSLGTHRLYFRTKNQEGRWAITQAKDFIVDNDFSYPPAPAAVQNIVAAEYFIDADPGFGSASSIAVTPATNINNLSVAVNTTGLTSGTHRLFVRTKNQEGSWSIVATDTFATSLMKLSVDTLAFGTTPVNTTLVKNLVVTNSSAVNQNINTAVIHAPFSTNFSGVITLTPGQTATLPISFLPTTATGYIDSVVLGTSAGSLKAVLTGTGITQIASWALDPASGHDYGNTVVNTGANYSFTIRNTGNIDVALSGVTISNPAFVPTFTAGTVIPANGSISLSVAFTPTAVGQYTGQLKIQSSTSGVADVTTAVTGNGYAPGTSPVLQFVPGSPFNGTAGVNPAAGQAGLFTYKVLYQSANNLAPQINDPKLGVDLNGDGDFNDLNEGTFNMVKEGNSVDYVAGVVYSYTFNHTSNTSTAGYQFFAADANGNTASSTAYKSGPVVTDQQLDLRIFASDISFSKTNPQPGEAFTMTASITNSTAVPATNVPVKFYRDTILIGSAVIPAVNAFSSSSITRSLSFAAEGFFPIKVWIDSSNTLGESNILNNYAIRPVIVGSPNLPGGITVTTNATAQQCPQLRVLITGTATYFGTGTATVVAGAAVTINTGTQIINTTTDANGNYSFLLTGVTCGNFTYTVSVTDFTFTSTLLTNGVSLPCPGPNTCAVPPQQGGISASISTAPCSNLVGNTANMNFIVKYRSRDINNMWGLFDEIVSDTLKVFKDGVLEQTILSADFSHAPGEERIIPVSLPLSSTSPVSITGELVYTYIEYKQIPTSIYHGERTKIVATGGGSIQPALNQPDLTIQSFVQTGFTAFDFNDANVKCGVAGSHVVKVFDSLPGGSFTLIKTSTIASLGGGQALVLHFSDPTLVPGTHTIKIITDTDGTVTEQDETNNIFMASIVVPKPDLTITALKASPTALPLGSSVNFVATIKNSGKNADSFYVRFMVNGVQLGARKRVAAIGEKGSVQVTSDAFTVNTADNTCGTTVDAYVDVTGLVDESDELNNGKIISLSSDLAAYQLPNEAGAAGNPVIVRVNTSNQFFPAIRNIGERDVDNVTVKYTLNSSIIGDGSVAGVKAGELFAAHGSFTHTFTAPGDYVVKVLADTANTICEIDETNNEGSFFIRVVDSKPDFEVLSQYISPSSLNPNAAQNITIVGTVKNTGGKPTTASVLRFLVDDIQLGADVPINALQPGKDTTVAAIAAYSSLIAGVKIMKIVADPSNTLAEEREDNNEATRALIVGDAPDMARSHPQAISFNPGGFSRGDNVQVSYSIKNNGVQQGTAWARFFIYDDGNALRAADSVQFTLAAGATTMVSRNMQFDIDRGTVITDIVNCSPVEFDLLNNTDTLAFSTVMMLKANTSISGDLDMKAAAPVMLPGWIGGKLVLGDYDLVVNGKITNFDTAHFVVTNGAGKLTFTNSNAVNTFPVAASLDHPNFVKINNAGTPDNFTVRVVPYVLQNGSTGDTLKAGYVNRTWLIEEQVAGGSNATLTFSWNVADEQGGFSRVLSRTAHYTGSWQLGDPGAAITDSAAWFSRLQNGFTSFSPFTVTSVTAGLPLHLLQFTAAAKDNGALLGWQTDNEINTSHFVVQHSMNGLQFEDAGSVTARNTSGVNNYSFVHGPLTEGLHYYRLRMVDIDGKFTYSPVKLVKTAAVTGLQLYPNPAGRFVTIQGLEANGILRIFTLDGRLLKQWTATGSSLLADLGGMAGGMYIVTWSNHGKTMQRQLVKQ